MAITRAYMTPPSIRRCETQLVDWLRVSSRKCLNYRNAASNGFSRAAKRKGKLESSFESQSWSHFSYSWHSNRNVCGDPTSLKLFKNIEKRRASCFSCRAWHDRQDAAGTRKHRSMQLTFKKTLQKPSALLEIDEAESRRSPQSAAHSTDSSELILSSARLSQPATISGFSLDRMLRAFFGDSFDLT